MIAHLHYILQKYQDIKMHCSISVNNILNKSIIQLIPKAYLINVM